MRTTYEFGDGDESQRQVFERAHAFHSALWDIANAIRAYHKYETASAEAVLERVNDIVANSGVWDIE